MRTLMTAPKLPENADGLIRILIFLTVLMLAFWGINVFRHIKSGSWTKFQKVTDTVGVIMLVGFLISLIVPIMR
ncbi:MAG: hypothetical protein J6B75_08420 [Ruminococcus sp.]|nr:hypothetical protein [Ruminococcus sp.]